MKKIIVSINFTLHNNKKSRTEKHKMKKKKTAKTTQYMFTKPGLTKIYKATTNTEREKLTEYDYSGETEYPIDSSG